MNITNNSHQVFTRKLVPLSEYKGIVLKLTNSDKKQIEELNRKKAVLELDLHAIERQLSKITAYTKEHFYYQYRIEKLEAFIEDINSLIKKIKIDRFAKQKANFEKKPSGH